jgi:hypothetical protein
MGTGRYRLGFLLGTVTVNVHDRTKIPLLSVPSERCKVKILVYTTDLKQDRTVFKKKSSNNKLLQDHSSMSLC